MNALPCMETREEKNNRITITTTSFNTSTLTFDQERNRLKRVVFIYALVTALSGPSIHTWFCWAAAAVAVRCCCCFFHYFFNFFPLIPLFCWLQLCRLSVFVSICMKMCNESFYLYSIESIGTLAYILEMCWYHGVEWNKMHLKTAIFVSVFWSTD